MNQAVLFVAHGTRDPNGVADSEELTTQLTHRIQTVVSIVETAYLEINSPTIPEGIHRCLRRGATSILLVPLLLFSAGHHKRDIPLIVHQTVKEGGITDCAFTIAPPLGLDGALLDVVLDRILEAKQGEDDETAAILAFRGNRDEVAVSQFAQLALRVKDESRLDRRLVSHTMPAVMTGLGLTLEDALNDCLNRGFKSIVVVPYLLFRGRVSQEMGERLKKWEQRHLGTQVVVGRCLWPDTRILGAFYSVVLASLGLTSADSDSVRSLHSRNSCHHCGRI